MTETAAERAAIYARVSTSDQDVARQLDEARDHLDRIGVEDVEEYPEVVSGAADTDTREVYNDLLDDVASGAFDLVVVHEISRLSRLGPTEIHEFIQHCLEHDTGVEALDVGLKIHVDDGELQQTIYSMVARLMGDLAQIEHQQKLQRIRSGVRAAQDAGKWTGRPPAGFDVEDGYLRVDPAEFLHIREALARVDRGEAYATVAEEAGVPESTLRKLEGERRDLYLAGNAADDRVDEALDEVRPLDDIRTEDVDLAELRERVEAVEAAVAGSGRADVSVPDNSTKNLVENTDPGTQSVPTGTTEPDPVREAVDAVELEGGGAVVEARREALAEIVAHLRDEGSATAAELKELVDEEDDRLYSDADSFWANMRRQNVFDQIDEVGKPGKGGKRYYWDP